MKTIVRMVRRMLRLFMPAVVQRRLYDYLSIRYARSLPRPGPSSRPNLLVIDHFFGQDVRALRNCDGGYNLAVVDFNRYFKSGRLYFPDSVLALEEPYESTRADVREKYRAFCRSLLEATLQRFEINAILTPSDCYISIREFILAAREQGIPTFVIDKEGTISPYSFELHVDRIRTMVPFISDHIFVWSQRQRDFWKRIGVTDERISIVGQARSDLFFAEKPRRVDKLFTKKQPLVSYFTFHDTAYIPPEHVAAGANWRQLKTETLDALMEVAAKEKDFNFVVKAHPQQIDLARLQENYRLDNLVVAGGSDIGNELIQRSELIIGFQTTAIIEGMFLGRKIIYTGWDAHCTPPLLDDLLPFHKAKGIVLAQSVDHFRQVVERVLRGDGSDFEFSEDEISLRERFVEQYLYQPDGHTCERIFHEMSRLLSEKAV